MGVQTHYYINTLSESKWQSRERGKNLQKSLEEITVSTFGFTQPLQHTNRASPAQRLFGRCTQTLLPVSAKLLKPEMSQQVPAKPKVAQQNQAKHYNKIAKTLVPLKRGDSVYLRLPGSTTWSPGVCKKLDHTW